MKKLILALVVACWPAMAVANVPCSLPYNLQNGTTADATQVMANYNALVTCLTNAAIAGANNDITALLALTTPIAPAGGGTTLFIGGTSGGSGNAQIVSSLTPSTFSLTAGYSVSFTAGASNTDATTLNAGGTGATNVYRRTQLGPEPLVGGEIVAGNPVTVRYDGTQWVIIGDQVTLVGKLVDYAGGVTAPAGTHFADGSCITRTGQGAALFSIIGTAYDPTGSTCDTAHFALPDFRGRVTAYQDNMGGSAANRITSGGSGCTGTTIGGAGCGGQTRTITQANLPAITVPLNGDLITANVLINIAGTPPSTGLGGSGSSGFTNTGAVASGPAFVQFTPTGTVGPLGSGTGLPVLNPLQIVTKLIQY